MAKPERAGLSALVVILLASCNTSSYSRDAVLTETTDGLSVAPSSYDAAQRHTALLRLLSGYPSSPVDVSCGSRKPFAAIVFRAMTPYDECPAGRTTVRMQPPATTTASLNVGEHYTLVAARKDDDSPALYAIEDHLTSPSPGKAKLRLLHAANRIGTVAAYESGKQTSLLGDVGFARASDYREFPPQRLTIEIHRKDDPSTLVEIPRLKLEAGKLYTLAMIGGAANPLEILEIVDQIQPAKSANQ